MSSILRSNERRDYTGIRVRSRNETASADAKENICRRFNGVGDPSHDERVIQVTRHLTAIKCRVRVLSRARMDIVRLFSTRGANSRHRGAMRVCASARGGHSSTRLERREGGR